MEERIAKKGDIVIVSAHVYTARREQPLTSRKEELLHRPNNGSVRTCLFRVPVTPWRGLVIGRSHLQTGEYDRNYDWMGKLHCDKAHIVLMVTPMGTERYRKPTTVLDGDVTPAPFFETETVSVHVLEYGTWIDT